MNNILFALLLSLLTPSASGTTADTGCAKKSLLKPGATWTWLLEKAPLAEQIPKAEAGKPPLIYDVDMFMITPAQIKELKQKGKVVICYVAGGSMQFSKKATFTKGGTPIPCADRMHLYARPELAKYLTHIPKTAIKGMIKEWPDNCWLDPRYPSVLKALDGIATDAKARGCDGVEFDNMDAGFDEENRAEANFNAPDEDMEAAQLKFNLSVADMLHSKGLCAAIKNGHMFAEKQCEKYDLAVVENIVHEGGEGLDGWKKCALDKPVLAAEYPEKAKDYKCPYNAGNLTVNFFADRKSVDGGEACPSRQPLPDSDVVTGTTR